MVEEFIIEIFKDQLWQTDAKVYYTLEQAIAVAEAMNDIVSYSIRNLNTSKIVAGGGHQ